MPRKFNSVVRKKSGYQGNKKPQRKKYSLHNVGKKNSAGFKRKFSGNNHNSGNKRRRPDHDLVVPNDPPVNQVEEEEDVEEEEEIVDDLQQLLSSFGNTNTNIAIESDTDSEVSDDEENVLSEGEEAEIDEAEISASDDEGSIEEDLNQSEDEEKLSNDDEQQGDVQETAEENAIEEVESDIEIQVDNEVHDDSSEADPFVKHFLYEISESLLNSIETKPPRVNTHVETWPTIGKMNIQIPVCEHQSLTECTAITIEKHNPKAQPGEVPKRIDTSKTSLNDLHVKTQLIKNVTKANISAQLNSKKMLSFTPLQSEIFSIINNYQDLYLPQRTFTNLEEIRFCYCLHAMNHIMKTRLKVIHHNARLTKKDDVPEDFRDQGLVRPKVLIVLPFRDSAYKVINMFINILLEKDEGNVVNKKRFIDEFTGSELIMPKKNPKPEDYELLFSGNSNDEFKIGITITKKSLKLYADFYSSDIIIASPLGLRTIIGAEGEADRDYDFLASIELLIFDQMEIFLMQNWDHVMHIFKHLHLQPKESHGTDFSRVRTWSLNGWSKYYRQTLIFSSLQMPEFSHIFNRHCLNFAGKVRCESVDDQASIRLSCVPIAHIFHKIEAKSFVDIIEARFQYFITKIIPEYRHQSMYQTMIVIPNYFDYVRVRNYLKKEDIGFVQICEYTNNAKTARARDMFFHGSVNFMLYTERFHFFNRKRIKGIRHLIFYQLPTFPHFYPELCNFMQVGNMNKKVGSDDNMSICVLYSKYDIHQMSAVVGKQRATAMIQKDKKMQMIITDYGKTQ